MLSTYVLYSIVFVVAFVLVGLYCAAETSFTAANRMAVRALAEGGDARARVADLLLEDRSHLIRVLLVGINLFMVISSVLSASFFKRSHVLGRHGPIIGALVLVLLTLVLAEIVPKRVAQADPTGTALRLAPLAKVSVSVFTPVAAVLGALPQWIAGRIAHPTDDLSVTSESLSEMTRLGEEQGSIEHDTGDMIEGILSSGDRLIRDLMVPFSAVVITKADASLASLAGLAQETGFSRFPVMRGIGNQVVGIVHVKDVAARLFTGHTGTAEQILRPVLSTRPDTKAKDLLAEMRSRRQHLAVVEASPATPVGIVTIEDLLGQIL